jgi:hypothetical protein
MVFTDKICYDVAKDIINNIFLVKYEEGKKYDKTWYENLNTFLVIEWDRLQEKEEDKDSQFTGIEEDMITREAFDILLDKLNVNDDEFEEYEQEVDWMKFDDIIGHYVCFV